jgi:2-polyprenyl-6-methoxyphenol hydroxylase-like FAD-dependent oxidoreductase
VSPPWHSAAPADLPRSRRISGLGVCRDLELAPITDVIVEVYGSDRDNQFDLCLIAPHTSAMEVLIAGAGIAGMATAIAMTKAGHRVAITEQASQLREVGAALSIWPNALAALDYLGVGEQVRAASIEAPSASIRSSIGADIVRFDIRAMRRALGGVPVVVLRAGLQSALYAECTRLGVEIRLGQAVKSVCREGRHVRVTTTSADEATFDAAIGADGINSAMRSAVVRDGDLRDCDRTAWRALISNGDGLVSETWLTVGVGLQLIASPAPNGLAYWAADTPGSDAATAKEHDRREVLARRFSGWHQPIPEIIETTPRESLIVSRIYDRRPPRKLQRGRILLVGDAAHAMTPDLGQGACQALEDAAILLARARAHPTAEPAALFESFERMRLRRARQMVRDSYRIGRLATSPSRFAAGTRDILARLVPEAINNRRLAMYASTTAFGRQLERAAG